MSNYMAHLASYLDVFSVETGCIKDHSKSLDFCLLVQVKVFLKDSALYKK